MKTAVVALLSAATAGVITGPSSLWANVRPSLPAHSLTLALTPDASSQFSFDVAPATSPSISGAVDPVKKQTDALNTSLDVSYRRAYLIEIIQDLNRRSGVTVVRPTCLNEKVTITVEANQATVSDILKKVAAVAHFDVQFQPTEAVVTMPADAAEMDRLTKALKDPDRWTRCAAIYDLAATGDAKVPAMLVRMLVDGDAGVRQWALCELDGYKNFVSQLDAPTKEALADAIIKQVDEVAADPAQRLYLLQHDAVATDVQLLTCTGTDKARQSMAEWAKSSVNPAVRYSAAMYLVDSGCPDAVAILMSVCKDARQIIEQDRAARKGNDNQALAADDPVLMANTAYLASLSGLSRSDAPDAIAFVKAQREPRPLYGFTMNYAPPMGGLTDDVADPFMRDLKARYGSTEAAIAWAKHALEQQVNEKTAPASEPAPAAADEPGNKPGAGAYQSPAALKEFLRSQEAAMALNILAQFNNADGSALVLKAVQDTELLKRAAGKSKYQVWRIAPSDAAIVEAILKQLDAPGASADLKIYLIRSLSFSKDQRAFDKLVALLQDPDAAVRAEDAMALASTHDPRATAPIAALLQTSTKQMDWPDLEEQARQQLAAGQSVRMVQNPRKVVAGALAETRDPKALDLLLQIAATPGIDEDARQAALMSLGDAVLSNGQLDTFADHVSRMKPEDQRTALFHLRGTNANFTMWSSGFVSAFSAEAVNNSRCLNDARVVDLLTARARDPESARAYNGIQVDNEAIRTLAGASNPRAEHALLNLCKDPDEHIAYFAARTLKQINDPQLDIKLEH